MFSSLLALSIVGLTGCQSNPVTHLTVQPEAQASLTSTANNMAMGNIRFSPASNGVRVYGTVSGLEANSVHAIHIHEKPDCGNMGEAAGGHFNPMKTLHGNPIDMNSHSGELPNITANANGVATLDFVNPRISLATDAPQSVYNHAIIVHAKADDYHSQPSGNAGGRIACGIIGK